MQADETSLLQELNTLLAALAVAPCDRKDDVTARLTLELDGKRGGPRALSVESGHRTEIDIREMKVDPAVLELAQCDLRILGDILARHPEGIVKLFARLRAGDSAGAFAIGRELGLTEEHFRAEGGGLWGIFVVAVALVLVTATPTSVEADPIPIPEDPVIVEDQVSEDMETMYQEFGE